MTLEHKPWATSGRRRCALSIRNGKRAGLIVAVQSLVLFVPLLRLN
jgi:hypothetical protein